jgi:hypothetical protein
VSVEEARADYLWLADVLDYWVEWRASWQMPLPWAERATLDLATDAASITYDLAVSEDVQRKAVAWA